MDGTLSTPALALRKERLKANKVQASVPHDNCVLLGPAVRHLTEFVLSLFLMQQAPTGRTLGGVLHPIFPDHLHGPLRHGTSRILADVD